MPKMPSIQAMEILAVSDQPVFESLMNHIGLQVEGRVNEDPLETQVQTESISAIATGITEEACGYIKISKNLREFKTMAEDYGYVVGLRNRRR